VIFSSNVPALAVGIMLLSGYELLLLV